LGLRLNPASKISAEESIPMTANASPTVLDGRRRPLSLAPVMIALALCVTNLGVGPRAYAGPLVTAAYQFDGAAGPGYRYVSGDLPAEATARLTGQLTLEYDAETGAAVITSLTGSLYSPTRIVGFSDSELTALDGADLESSVPGLFDGMTGARVASGAFFEFGPRLATSAGLFGEFQTRFELSLSGGGARLLGQAAFNGLDGPIVYVDAALVQIPEPASGGLAIAGAAIATLPVSRIRRRRRGERSARFGPWDLCMLASTRRCL
jgi:hypothetical protein